MTDEQAGLTDDQLELIALNANLREHMDVAALQEIISGKPDGATIKRWRQSMGLSVAGLALSMHFSRRHLLRIENGHWPVNDHFMKSLRPFAQLIERGLPYMPHGTEHHPRPADLAKVGGISRGRIVGHGEFRNCGNPGCKRGKLYFTNPRQVYCSKRCKDAAARSGAHRGAGDRKLEAPRVQLIRCPACGDIHPTRGNLLRGDPPAGDGQAADDTARQVDEAAVSDEGSLAVGPDPRRLQHGDEILSGDLRELGGRVSDDEILGWRRTPG